MRSSLFFYTLANFHCFVFHQGILNSSSRIRGNLTSIFRNRKRPGGSSPWTGSTEWVFQSVISTFLKSQTARPIRWTVGAWAHLMPSSRAVLFRCSQYCFVCRNDLLLGSFATEISTRASHFFSNLLGWWKPNVDTRDNYGTILQL